jgi:hypothetical protein
MLIPGLFSTRLLKDSVSITRRSAFSAAINVSKEGLPAKNDISPKKSPGRYSPCFLSMLPGSFSDPVIFPDVMKKSSFFVSLPAMMISPVHRCAE